MIRPTLVAFASACIVGCQGSPPDVASEGDGTRIPACTWPAAADTFDPASGVGCHPRSVFEICEVPPGSVVHGDGTITTPIGATVTCDDPCSPVEYALSCYGPPLGPPVAPPSSLGCRPIPIPTRPDVAFHCCPCTP